MPLAHTIHEITLQNGAKGLFIDVPGATTVDYEFHFRGGYLYTGDLPYETPHLLEHMLYGVSPDFATKTMFIKAVTKNAAYANAFTNHEAVTHVGDAPQGDWLRVLALRTTAITRPRFTPKDITSEQGNVREEMTRNLTDLERLVRDRAAAALGLSVLTSQQRIALLDTPLAADTLERYYKWTHATNNLRFIVAGDSSYYQRAVIDQLEKWTLPAGERLAPAPVTLSNGRRYVVTAEGGANNAWINLAFAIPRHLSDRERLVARMMMRLLTNGMAGRILTSAREKGICYQMSSFVESYGANATVWSTTFPVSIGNLQEMLELVATEIRTFIEEGLIGDELTERAAHARGMWQMSGQTTGQLLAEYRTGFVADGPVVSHMDQLAMIDTVTADELVGLAREFVESNCSALSIVTASTDAVLVELGDMFHARLDGVH